MKKPIVPLKLVMDEVEMADDCWYAYLDLEKMEVYRFPDGTYNSPDEEDMAILEQIDLDGTGRFLRLPDKYYIHEYKIMEQFVWSLPEGRIQNALARAISGRGAFRRFKDGIIRYDIEQKWYDFQSDAYHDIAVRWCKEHELRFQDDYKPKTGNRRQKFIRKDPLEWEEINTDHLVQDEWIDFRSTYWRLPDGSDVGPYYSYTRKDYAVVVASDEEGNYICVRQFRQGIREVTTEFPAGCIDLRRGKITGSNDRDDFAAFKAAKRELLEETGYVSDDWEYLLDVPANATVCDNYAFLFIAKNCRRIAEPSPDDTEFLEVVKLSAEQIEMLIKQGGFQQAMHIAAWLLARR